MKKTSSTYSRGELATLTAVKGETIRYYEKCGLLAQPPRSSGGHRMYSEDQVASLRFIRRCRELGFSLKEISGLLSLASAGSKSCEQVQELTEIHLNDVQEKLQDLKKMERTLKTMIKQCDSNTAPSCPVITALFT